MAALELNPELFDIDVERQSTRDGYGEGVLEAGRKNKNIVVLAADLAKSTKCDLFAQEFPERFMQMGVAEQNMAGVAAGLALSGKIPFMASFGVFNPGRNWEQIRVAICLSQANVKIIASHSGFSDGADGATHQALEDIALLRVLPNMTVVVPVDIYEAKKATLKAADYLGPVSIRISRDSTPVITTAQTPFEIGKAQILREGTDITIIGCGPILYEALKAANKLNEDFNINCEILNCSTIKPLDETAILTSVKKTQKVITIEEHQLNGGLGSAIAELLSEKHPVQIKRLGVNNMFGESGKHEELITKFGLDITAVIKCVKDFCMR